MSTFCRSIWRNITKHKVRVGPISALWSLRQTDLERLMNVTKCQKRYIRVDVLVYLVNPWNNGSVCHVKEKKKESEESSRVMQDIRVWDSGGFGNP
jgi:chorismate-pyruvate lyase